MRRGTGGFMEIEIEIRNPKWNFHKQQYIRLWKTCPLDNLHLQLFWWKN